MPFLSVVAPDQEVAVAGLGGILPKHSLDVLGVFDVEVDAGQTNCMTEVSQAGYEVELLLKELLGLGRGVALLRQETHIVENPVVLHVPFDA